MRLLSRERGTPAERGIVPIDILQGTPQRRLSLPPPHSVDEEEKAFLKEVEVSAQLELLDEQKEEEEKRTVRFERISDSAEPEGKMSFPSSIAACTAASTIVSLSESEGEEEALSAIAEAYTVPQWDDNARPTELANKLTALTLAGVPVRTHPCNMLLSVFDYLLP